MYIDLDKKEMRKLNLVLRYVRGSLPMVRDWDRERKIESVKNEDNNSNKRREE